MAEAVRKGEFFNHIIPVPEDLKITAGWLGNGTPEQLELERKEQANLEMYGFKNWYDFCTESWGTKWDVDPYDPEDVVVRDGKLEFSFDTAWSPAVGIYQEMIKQGYDVVAYYHESGMCFVGKWDNGDDHYYEYGDEDLKSMPDVIAKELDDMYGISESIAEYEDDE